ncbi:MAG TPA: SDR family NAD(P)-dependent oxidoreductase, partial [Armatimonadota bacterium]|nr:SDR family NAD(P)-dependent oxidoreductase [Armatimonadota bacterium]
MTQRHILVTGGAGFIGSHMVDRLLADGFRVTVLDNESTGNRAYISPKATFILGDVRNEADLTPIFEMGIDGVFHIAGQASIRQSFMKPENDLEVNTLGTINVLKQCIAHRVPRLIFASSMTIYGNPTVVPTPESAPANPVSYYGITKYAAERYVLASAARADLDFPFHVTCMRMFNVYGVRQSLTNSYQGVFAIFLGNVLR